MKIFALACILLTGQALADVQEIQSSKLTCQQLKDVVASSGTVIIYKKILLAKKRTLVHQSVECASDQTKHYGSFKTSNVRRCQVGEYCVTDPVYTDYSDYSSGSSSSDSSGDSGYYGS